MTADRAPDRAADLAVEIRALGEADDEAAWQLGRLAFGGPPQRPPSRRPVLAPGVHTLGAFAGGRLVGKAVGLEHAYVYGGHAVAGVGVASVAVAPEFRGHGLLRALLTPVVSEAREGGAALSALFPSAAVPYRRLGWEHTGVLRWTAVPTAALATERRPPNVTVRPAEESDVPAILGAYCAWAGDGAGMLTRGGPLFDHTPAAVLAGHDGHSVAVGPAGVEGYASWDRQGGYDAAGVLRVPDLVAHTPRALTALLAMLGTWRSVAPTLHLRLRPDDPTWLMTGLAGARSVSEQPWMLRLVDARAAVAARGWPAAVSGTVDLDLADDLCPWNAGPHRLTLEGGHGTLTRGGAGAGARSVHLGPGALAVLYAGARTPAVLRRAGLLSGGDERTDAFLTAATAGPAPALQDYF